MKDITVPPTAQLAAGGVVVAGIAALVASELPAIRRYLALRRM